MNQEQHPDSLFKEKFSRPLSQGEKEQVDRLRQFSSNPDEILQVRKSLQDSQNRQTKEEFNPASETEEDANRIANLREQTYPPTPQRRKYDKPMLTRKRKSFFEILFNIFSINNQFAQKYIRSKKVSFGFFNILSNNSFYFPSPEVIRLVDRELIPLVDLLQPMIKKIYLFGWCDSKGKRFFGPFDFNLISELERAMNRRYLENFLIHRLNPVKSLESLFPFLGYYLSITSKPDQIETVKQNIKTALTFMSGSPEDNLQTKDKKTINVLLDQFFSAQITEDFITPILECYYARPILQFDPYDFFQIEPISSTEFYADSKLLFRMKLKEENYRKQLFKKENEIQQQIKFLSAIQEALIYQRTSNQGNIDLIDFACQYHLAKIKGFSFVSNLFSHHKSYLATLFFMESYRLFLDKEIVLIPKKMPEGELASNNARQEFERALLFDSEIFSSEILALQNSLTPLQKIADKNFPKDDIFEKYQDDKNSEIFYYLITLNNVADQFYQIGEKIYRYLQAPQDCKEESSALTFDEMGLLFSYYHHHEVKELSESADFHFNYLFFQKKISNILYEIMSFAFQYCFHYENQHRVFASESNRKKTLKSFLKDRSSLEEERAEILQAKAQQP